MYFSSLLRARTAITPLHPERATSLIVDGPYRFTRNPMYLGLVLQLVAWAWWLSSFTPWLIIPLFTLILIRFQIKPEEKILGSRFGDAYRHYQSRVGRWLPF